MKHLPKASIISIKNPLLPAAKLGHLDFYEDQNELTQDFHQIASWLSQKESPHTRRAYKFEVQEFLKFVRKPLKAVETVDLAAYLLTKEDKKAPTRRRAKDSLSSLFTFLVQSRYREWSPAVGLAKIKVKNDISRRVVEKDLVRNAIEQEPSQRNKTLIDLVFTGGLRRSEAAELQFSDFALVTIDKKECVRMTVNGKRGKIRHVYLPSRFWEKIQSLKTRGSSSPYLFHSSWGPRLTTEQINKIIKAALIKAGGSSEASAHWLRHGHGYEARKAGADLRVLQKTLGHSSLNTTEIYTFVDAGESSSFAVDEEFL